MGSGASSNISGSADTYGVGLPGLTERLHVEGLIPRGDATPRDGRLSGKPIYLLACLCDESQAADMNVLAPFHGRLVFAACARTVVGKRSFCAVQMVEFQTSQGLLDALADGKLFGMDSPADLAPLLAVSKTAGFSQVCYPLDLDEEVTLPEFTRASLDMTASGNACADDDGGYSSFPSGQRRFGNVSADGSGFLESSIEQAEAYLDDPRFQDRQVWHLHMLDFEDYTKYVDGYAFALSDAGALAASGVKAAAPFSDNLYTQHDPESRFTVFGAVVFQSRNSYFALGASPLYAQCAAQRREALAKTYTLAMIPELVADNTIAGA
eukprot:TRINITY_DN37153_c0_g1_i2.p1 TRINITY_DN37153_c0_g1~~TRINITY_DN37153_c0_g1_i2.p1  ORF type:complete len:324 (-),score=50.94 TRINITY_DN37153_c0_g1_i2:20-991(-)